MPEVISERIIEPAGGTAIENASGLSCDRVLKNQFVFQRAASNKDRMNAVVKQIQAQRSECAADIWNPVVSNADDDFGCYHATKVGDTEIPRGLWDTTHNEIRGASSRDAENNIIVHFDHDFLPTGQREVLDVFQPIEDVGPGVLIWQVCTVFRGGAKWRPLFTDGVGMGHAFMCRYDRLWRMNPAW